MKKKRYKAFLRSCHRQGDAEIRATSAAAQRKAVI